MDLSAPFPLNCDCALVLQQFSVFCEIIFPDAYRSPGRSVPLGDAPASAVTRVASCVCRLLSLLRKMGFWFLKKRK